MQTFNDHTHIPAFNGHTQSFNNHNQSFTGNSLNQSFNSLNQSFNSINQSFNDNGHAVNNQSFNTHNQSINHSGHNQSFNDSYNLFNEPSRDLYVNEGGRNFGFMQSSSEWKNKDNCHSCCGMLSQLFKDFDTLKEDVDKIKKKLKKSPSVPCAESDNTSICSSGELINGHTKEHIETKAALAGNLTEAVKITLRLAFTHQELMQCSVTGQKQNSQVNGAKPGLDEARRQYLEEVLGKRFGATVKDIQGKMRDRLKLYRKSNLGMDL